MTSNSEQNEKFTLCPADILSLIRRSKKTILYCALTVGLLGFLIALIRPVSYQAEGTFREKGIKSNISSSSSVMQFLNVGSSTGGESEAASLMASRKILKEVIETLGLQGQLQSPADSENIFRRIKNNSRLLWKATFSRSPQPILNDISCPLKFENLQYTGELPLALWINLKQEGNFEVLDLYQSKKLLGIGKLGESFQLDQASFTLLPSNSNQTYQPQFFIFSIQSLVETTKQINQILKVEIAKLDKGLLNLKCEHRNRFTASTIINTLMEKYQNYLKTYHQQIALNQLEYLNDRQEQLKQTLGNLMEKHADLLSSDLYNSGFIESAKEMDFLAKSQHEYKQKLLDNEMEIKRISTLDPTKLAYYNRFSAHEGDSSVINNILSNIRSLKQQRDSLEIEVQKKSIDKGTDLQLSFDQQLKELKEIQEYLADLQEIKIQYEQGNVFNFNSKLVNDNRFLLKGWLERLQNVQNESSNNWKETNENFNFYLNNLERLFGVHERILQERLTHQQNPSGEYQGISLEVATSLYLDYSKQLIQMEGNIRQNLFFIHQIEDQNFEITSLSSGLTDAISQSMLAKASELILNLRDQNNQSSREQERIKEQLALQRTFLTLHLKQMVQLMELNKQLIDEKIFSLQNVSLELIHQQISLLEKNLQDYLSSRLTNLQQERNLVKRQLESVHNDMALLPHKWASEQTLLQAVTTNQHIVEEIAKLVESKNISHNLEVIQSAPVDYAYPPVHPKTPNVAVFAIIGLLLGGSLGTGYVLAKALNTGFIVSPENLESKGFHFSGYLNDPLISPLTKQIQPSNLETLRRLQSYFDSNSQVLPEQKAKVLLLLEGQGPSYAESFVALLLKKNYRVLTIDLNKIDSQKDKKFHLLAYLKGEILQPAIQQTADGDKIIMGEFCSSIIERVSSSRFQQLIENLKINYDWILVVSKDQPCSAEAESLLASFPNSALTLTDEKITDLNKYGRFLSLDNDRRMTFILDQRDA